MDWLISAFPAVSFPTVIYKKRHTLLNMARNDRNPKMDKVKSRKMFKKLQRRHKSHSVDGESFGRVVGQTLLSFIRSMATRGLVFFFFCILIKVFTIFIENKRKISINCFLFQYQHQVSTQINKKQVYKHDLGINTQFQKGQI